MQSKRETAGRCTRCYPKPSVHYLAVLVSYPMTRTTLVLAALLATTPAHAGRRDEPTEAERVRAEALEHARRRAELEAAQADTPPPPLTPVQQYARDLADWERAREAHRRHVRAFHGRRRAAGTLTALGGALLAGGAILVLTATSQRWPYATAYSAAAPPLLAGLATTSIGIGLFAKARRVGPPGPAPVRPMGAMSPTRASSGRF